ncbi:MULTISPECIES: ParB N-terminal domain-containing protein [Citrobacter]|uniref:ParB N-terminal domain-containing protein n=1 Tax=Citrobacter TaxID=544 RepID=UPI00214D1BAD|nr:MULTISPECIES: ParB N-terminal domain-containing protein [Citrobacter]EKT9262963.1 ParB N-terminal domain-containing protein [Citrobacter freundii]EKU4728648.1 ParB N-terminal domain-containing protein [Citrobacter freundii]EKV2291862.1 ParB N-terminal domain-containing protein [Citrobacter freundii]EKW0768349.1 ParB N-terminal domain-containing protein [Citrobacter freundii]MCR3680289.1 ParB N-terminal domain-containing protein [Citrobacter freundii]
MLDLNADITPLYGAKYNPRHIDDKELELLADSIKFLGLVKPLIARGDLLVAGHQRTKVLQRLGINTAAVYKLPRETTVYDEIRFNQLHNGTDSWTCKSTHFKSGKSFAQNNF